MGAVAFLFAGQGAQLSGMGADLYENEDLARRAFDLAESIRPGTIETCFRGEAEELTRTLNAQPCLYVMDYACALLAEKYGGAPAALAGFSLGELAACAHAGLFSFETGLRLVMRRAEFMEAAARENPGRMLAVVRLSAEKAEEICEGVDGAWPVNYNCPGQTVVACREEAAPAIEAAARAAGGRALRLRVSGAFHSPLMAGAASAFRRELDAVSFAAPRAPLYANVSARPYAAGAEAETLSRQIASPVRWEDTIRAMARAGIRRFVELGAGETLSGLIAKIDPALSCRHIGDMASLREWKEAAGC